MYKILHYFILILFIFYLNLLKICYFYQMDHLLNNIYQIYFLYYLVNRFIIIFMQKFNIIIFVNCLYYTIFYILISLLYLQDNYLIQHIFYDKVLIF